MKARSFRPKFEQKFSSPRDSLKVEQLSDRDHFMYKIYYKNEYISILQISFGSKEFDKKLRGLMARQLGISSEELIGIEKCTFYAKDFVRKSSKILP